MSKISTQVIHNLKKDKGSFVSFGLIVLFTAFMLNLALVLAFQVDEAYDTKFDELNAASINLYIPEMQDMAELPAELSAIDGVSMVEARPAVYAEAVVRDFRGTDFDMNTVFYNMDDARSVNLLDVREQAAVAQEPAIWLPMYVANFGEFAVGERQRDRLYRGRRGGGNAVRQLRQGYDGRVAFRQRLPGLPCSE